MARRANILPILILLAACAGEPADMAGPPLPLPPPAPPRPPALRHARPVPGTAEAAAVAALNGNALPPAATANTFAQDSPAPSWRVARDGVVGCADPATLAVLGQPAERTPRALAEAREAGGCRTTFRMNAWAAEAVEQEMVRLRLLNGSPLTLWFRRGDVIAP